MESDFNETFYLDSDEQKQIKSEKSYVDVYCPNVHIMELVFDIIKLVECDTSIRDGLSASASKYLEYKQGASVFFKSFILQHWDRLTQYINIFDMQVISGSTVKLQTSTPVPAPAPTATQIKTHEHAATVLKKQIESDIDNIKNRLKNSGYNEVHDHLMIAYFPKLAHTYTVCCKTNESPFRFLLYLLEMDTFSYRSDILKVFSLSWLVSCRE